MYIDKEVCYKELAPTIMGAEKSQGLRSAAGHQGHPWCQFRSKFKGRRRWISQLEEPGRERFAFPPFRVLGGGRSSVGWMRSPTLGRAPSSLGPSNLMLVSPRNTLTDAPSALLNQASGSCGPIT